jgi:hypothetical protein
MSCHKFSFLGVLLLETNFQGDRTMLKISLVVALMFFVGLSCEAYAQDVGQRTSELVSALDKTKYKKKEKANVSIEIYINIKNEPAVRDAYAYGGNYGSEDSMYRLTLHVERGGAATGSGYDTINGERRVNFTLKDATINGALLTATKVYENGETQKFEAVFVNRTVSSGKNENEIASRDTKFGLGFIQNGTWSDDKSRTMNYTNRVFLEGR